MGLKTGIFKFYDLLAEKWNVKMVLTQFVLSEPLHITQTREEAVG